MNCNNKLLISFTYLFIFLLCSLTLLAAAEEATTSTTTTKNDNDEEYYNLEAMTNEELEEICTSRGFELVRETDEKDYPIDVAAHQIAPQQAWQSGTGKRHWAHRAHKHTRNAQKACSVDQHGIN